MRRDCEEFMNADHVISTELQTTHEDEVEALRTQLSELQHNFRFVFFKRYFPVTRFPSRVTCHALPITRYLSQVTTRTLPLTRYPSVLTLNLSRIT